MTIAFVGGTGVSTTGAAKGTTSTTVSYNNVAAGRLGILTVGAKPNTGTITTPTGWTKIGEQQGGTGTNAADTGQTIVAAYYRILDGSETGTVTVNGTSTGSIQGSMDVFSKTLGNWDVSTFVVGSDASHAANLSAVCGTWSSDGINSGDHIFVAHSGDTDDSTTATSAPTITQTSVTLGTVTGRSQVRNTSGNQGMTYTWSAPVTTASVNANAPTVGFTWTVSSCGPVMAIRMREYDAFSALTETFASALDSTKWTTVGGATTGSGVETFDLTGYTEIFSVRNYSISGSYVLLNTVTFPADNGAYYAGLRISQYGNAGTDFIGIYSGGNGTGGQTSLERTGTTAVVIPRDTTNHKWIRIRDDGGSNIYLETSPDGITWTVQRTLTGIEIPSWRGNTGLQVAIEGGNGGTWVFDDFNNAPVATNAPATTATGTGSASDATVAMLANAEAATATGSASDATVATGTTANAEVATGTGVASDAVATVATSAEVATASGAGQDAGVATTINADVAVAAGQAAPASVTLLANAEAATGSGSALDATITTVNAILAPAELAAGAGSALDIAPDVGANASAATASGSALDALSTLQALPPSPSGTGAAFDAATALLAGAVEALGLGVALDATVSTFALVNASAEAPEAAGVALGASVTSSATVEAPVASGSALDATVIIGATASAAAALGSALDAIASAVALAEAPAGAGQAPDATVASAATTNAPAAVATGVGQAPDALVAMLAGADVAMATGAALDGLGSVATLPSVATGGGSAGDATVSAVATTTAPAGSADGTGSAGDASITIVVSAAVATGLGITDGAVAAIGVPADLATSVGQAYSAVAALGALAALALGIGEALDLDTGGHTTSPTPWLVTESRGNRALITMTSGPLISQTRV